MNTKLHNAADQFIGLIDGQLACHWSVIQFPMRKGWKRGHRLVVLPDFQGIGIGTLFHNYCAELVSREGWRINSTTTTPALINSMIRDKSWALVRKGRVKSKPSDFVKYGRGDKSKSKSYSKSANKCISKNRITFSFNYRPNGQN